MQGPVVLRNMLIINGYSFSAAMKLEDFMTENKLSSFKLSREEFKAVKSAYSRAVANDTLIDGAVKSARYAAASTKEGLVIRQTVTKEGALDRSNKLHREAFERYEVKQAERADKIQAEINLFKAQCKANDEAEKVRQEQALAEAIEKAAQEKEAEKLVADLEKESSPA